MADTRLNVHVAVQQPVRRPFCSAPHLSAVVTAVVLGVLAIVALTQFHLTGASYYTAYGVIGLSAVVVVIVGAHWACSRRGGDQNPGAARLDPPLPRRGLRRARSLPELGGDHQHMARPLSAGGNSRNLATPTAEGINPHALPELGGDHQHMARPLSAGENPRNHATLTAEDINPHALPELGADDDDDDEAFATPPEAAEASPVDLQRPLSVVRQPLSRQGSLGALSIRSNDEAPAMTPRSFAPVDPNDLGARTATVNVLPSATSTPDRSVSQNTSQYYWNMAVEQVTGERAQRPGSLTWTGAALGVFWWVGQQALSAVSSGITALQKHYLTGGSIQNQLQLRLMTGLVDGLIVQMGGTAPRMNLFEKTTQLLELIRQDYGISISDQRLDPQSLQAAVQLILVIFRRFGRGESHPGDLRYALFDALKNVYYSVGYQAYLSVHGRPKLGQCGCPEETRQAIQFVQTVAYIMFTGVKLGRFTEESIDTVLQTQDRIQQEATIVRQLENECGRIREAPPELKGDSTTENVHKLSGHLGINFRPLALNNYPQNLLRMEIGGQPCELLRFGTPTEQSINGAAELEPVFLLFLDWLREHDQQLLSCQLQNRQPKRLVQGDESARVDLMIGLGNHPRYRDVIKVLALPHDSPFYYQTGNFEQRNNAEPFKEDLLDQIFDPQTVESYFLIPVEGEEQAVVRQEITQLINQLHQTCFSGRAQLSQEERHIFQELVYAFMVPYFIAYFQAPYAHIQCKDSMDRTMSLVAIFHYLSMLRLGQHQDPVRLKEFKTLIHGSPILIKGIPMHGRRFNTLCRVMDHLETLSGEQQQAIQAMRVLVRGAELRVSDLVMASEPSLGLKTAPSEENTYEGYTNALSLLGEVRVRLPYVERLRVDQEYPLDQRHIHCQVNENCLPIQAQDDVSTTLQQYGVDPGVLQWWADRQTPLVPSEFQRQAQLNKAVSAIMTANQQVWSRSDVINEGGVALLSRLTDFVQQQFEVPNLVTVRRTVFLGDQGGRKGCGPYMLNLVIGEKDVLKGIEVYGQFEIEHLETQKILGYVQARMGFNVHVRQGVIECSAVQRVPFQKFRLFSENATAVSEDTAMLSAG